MMNANDIFKEILPKVKQTIRTSSALSAQDVNFYSSLDRGFSDDVTLSSRKLVDLANQLVQRVDNDSDPIDINNDSELVGSNWKIISNTIDHFFEQVDGLFEQVEKGGRSNANSNSDDKKSFTYLEDSNNTLKDESRQIAKKMEKPQVNFKVPIDNEEVNPFKSKLYSKPNALKSYQDSTQLTEESVTNDDGETILQPPSYPHPYEYEIDTQPYPEFVFEKSEPIPPTLWHDTEAIWVDTPEKVQSMLDELSNLNIIAIDLEHHDYRTYYGLVCLMQISNREHDWIVDTLALRDDLQPLNKVFTDPNIVKVLHGAFMDIIWLQRDLGLYVVSLFDTYHASRKLGFPKFSLAYLLETFAHFKTSKRYQLADWRIRPLLSSMLAYARSDTHFLLYIFDQMKNKLIDANNEKLQQVLYESRQVAKRRFEYTKFRPSTSNTLVSSPVMAPNPNEPYMPIVNLYSIPYHNKPVVLVLYEWRDKLARKLDESVRFVMPNQTLALLSGLTRPVDTKKVLGIPTYVTEHVRNNASELASLIDSTLAKLEDNDWKLMDKADNTESDAMAIDNIEDISPASIKLQSRMFNDAIARNIELLDNKRHNQLAKTSVLFQNNSSDRTLGISYGKNKVAVSLKDSDFNERATHAIEEFNKYNDSKSDINEILVASPENDKIEEQPAHKAPENPEPSAAPPVLSQEPDESKDDIISLRKPKRNNKQKQADRKRSKPSEPQEAFDYSTSDKLLKPSDNSDDGKSKKNNKKRAFDPYAKDAKGPQPAKKARNMHAGRSATFTKKK